MAERRLQDVLDGLVAAFAGWTVGYQLGFVLRLPAIVGASLGLALAVVAVYLVLRLREAGPEAEESDLYAKLSVLLILGTAVGLAVLSTLMNRPDADDITFFPRVAAQLSHLWSPILTADTTSDIARLPGPSTGCLLTSWEFLLALGAHIFGLDALSVYQNGGAALGSALVAPLYYVLLRKLGLRPLLAVAAVAGAVAFLLLDGNDHHSMGNLAFVRLWQGKAVLLTLLPAYLLLHGLDYIWHGRRRSWLCVVLAGVAATGLSTVGCFFAPAAIGLTTVAVGGGLLVARQVERRLVARRALRLLIAAVYPLAVVALTLISPFPGTFSPLDWSRVATSDPTGQSSVSSNGALGWLDVILLPPSSLFRMCWALLLVVITPLIGLKRPFSFVVALFAPLFLLVVANPLSAGLLYRAVPEVYWRFYYLLPVPLCAGLLVAVIVRAFGTVARPSRVDLRTAAGVAAGIALAVAYIATISLTTVSSGNVGFTVKSPTAWKLDKATVGSVGPSLPALRGRRVLADQVTSVALALIDPSIHVLAQRPANTLVEFALAGQADEGQARVVAQNIAAGAVATAQNRRTFTEIASRNADVVIVRSTANESIAPLLAATGKVWRKIRGDELYTIYIR